MINKVTMRGIKGANTTQELTGRDIIIGHNGAGKTTRAQAVGLSLLGYVPGGGKLPAETFKLATGNAMTVGLETDSFSFTRTFESKDGKVSQSVKLTPPNAEKTVAAKEARIEGELGKVPVMLDFNEFLSLSDTKRREFIYQIANAEWDGEMSEETHRQMVRQTLTERLALNDAADPEQIKTLTDDIEECVALYRGGSQAGLQAMLDHAKEQTTFWKKERDKATGAAQKLTEYKNDLPEIDRDLDKNKAALATCQKELQRLTGEIATANTGNANLATTNARITALLAEIAELEAAVNPDDAAGLEELIKQYSGDIKTIDNSAKIAAAQATLTTAKNQKAEFERARLAKIGTYHEIKGKQDATQALIDKLTGANGVCAIDCRIKCDKDFSGIISDLTAEKANGDISLEGNVAEGTQIRAEIEKAAAAIEAAENEIARLNQEERDVRRENESIQTLVADLQKDLSRASGFEGERTAKLTAKREELKGLASSEAEPLWALTDTAELTAKYDGEKGKETGLLATIDGQTKTRNALAALKSSMVDGTVAGYHAENWKRIADAVGAKGLQGEMVKDTLAPLTEAIQAKLTAMGMTHRAFYFQTESDGGKEVFQFGWREISGDGELGERRNFDALSTGEQMLLLTALMTTIIEQLDPPLKVLIIDNAENLDRDNLRKVINVLTAAGANLDNIILCGVFEIEPTEVEGWKVWDLTEGAK